MATLVVRQDKVGDLVLATCVAEAVKKSAPSEPLYFMCSAYASRVLLGNPFIDEVIVLENPRSYREMEGKLRNIRVDKALVLFPTFPVSLAVFKAGIPVRCTTGFRWYQFLYNRITYLRRSKALMKEWEYNLKLARVLFPSIDVKSFYPRVYPTQRALEVAERVLGGFSGDKILVYPGGGGEKRWSPERFRKLCYMLEKNYSPFVVLGPGEQELKPFFERWLVPYNFDLEELVGIIALADAVVSNNTGPMHIAAALRKPLVQIFDPRRACNPRRWGHEYPGASILYPPVPSCDKCTGECPYYDCMEMIREEWVLRELERCLKEASKH